MPDALLTGEWRGCVLYLAPSFVVLMSAALWPRADHEAQARGARAGSARLRVRQRDRRRRTDRLTRRDSARRRRGLLLRDVYHLRALRSAALRQLYHDVLDVHVRGDRVTVFPQARGAAACVRKLTRCARDAGACRRIDGAALYLLYQGARGRGERQGSIIANVEPVVGALLGVLVFHETLDAWTVLGIVCVLGGVILLAGGEKAVEQAAGGSVVWT